MNTVLSIYLGMVATALIADIYLDYRTDKMLKKMGIGMANESFTDKLKAFGCKAILILVPFYNLVYAYGASQMTDEDIAKMIDACSVPQEQHIYLDEKDYKSFCEFCGGRQVVEQMSKDEILDKMIDWMNENEQ